MQWTEFRPPPVRPPLSYRLYGDALLVCLHVNKNSNEKKSTSIDIFWFISVKTVRDRRTEYWEWSKGKLENWITTVFLLSARDLSDLIWNMVFKHGHLICKGLLTVYRKDSKNSNEDSEGFSKFNARTETVKTDYSGKTKTARWSHQGI